MRHNLKASICVEYRPVETRRGRYNEDTGGRTCRPSRDFEDDHTWDHTCKNDQKVLLFNKMNLDLMKHPVHYTSPLILMLKW